MAGARLLGLRGGGSLGRCRRERGCGRGCRLCGPAVHAEAVQARVLWMPCVAVHTKLDQTQELLQRQWMGWRGWHRIATTGFRIVTAATECTQLALTKRHVCVHTYCRGMNMKANTWGKQDSTATHRGHRGSDHGLAQELGLERELRQLHWAGVRLRRVALHHTTPHHVTRTTGKPCQTTLACEHAES